MKHVIMLVQDGQQILIEVVATFLINVGAHMNILLINKVTILMLLKWSHRSLLPYLYFLLSLEWLLYIKYNVIQSRSTHLFTPNHVPLKYMCPIKISIWISHVYVTLDTQGSLIHWNSHKWETERPLDVPDLCSKMKPARSFGWSKSWVLVGVRSSLVKLSSSSIKCTNLRLRKMSRSGCGDLCWV